MFKKILIVLFAMSVAGIASAQNWNGDYWFTITSIAKPNQAPLNLVVLPGTNNNILPNYLVNPISCNGVTCSFAVNPGNLESGDTYSFYVTAGSDWQHYCQISYQIDRKISAYIQVTQTNCKGGVIASALKIHRGIQSNVDLM